MRESDARKNPAMLEERRKQVVRMSKQGYNKSEISKMCSLNWQTVKVALRLYEKGGMGALKPTKRGVKDGTRGKIRVEQEREIKKLICSERPEQLKLDFALWTREAVGLLIEQRYGIRLAVRTVGDYLSRWGYTPQKPIRRAYEQCPKAVGKWLNEDYPAIAKEAKKQGAEIHWGDETGVCNTDSRGRSYSPRGITPETRVVQGRRESFSMISSVSNQGKCHWMMVEGAVNSDRLIEFLEALCHDAGRKVFLVLDNLRVHHSKPVKAWLAKNEEKINIFYLPSYSPDLNPDERLNGDLKQSLAKRSPSKTRKALLSRTTQHMETLQKSPERIKSYFLDPKVRYAS